MGRHRKPSRIRLPQGATAAAAPTLATVAAAICLSTQAAAAPAADAAEVHTAVLDAASASQAALATAHPTTHGSATALPATYKVRRGDSLSSIAARLYHDRADWPALYWRNHNRIHWADDIYTGQVLRVPPKPARAPHAPAALLPPQRTAPVEPTVPVQVTEASSAGNTAVSSAAAELTTAGSDSGTPGGAFGACVIAAESGGNAQIMNSTGHYGLYQFSESTWVEYGGNPADFGHASVAEQNQVFANALAAGGESNWAPYDGC